MALGFGGWRGFGGRNQFAGAAFGFDFRFGGGTESMGADGQLSSQVAVAENLDFFDGTIGETGIAKGAFVHACTVIKLVKHFKIDGNVTSGVASIIKAALRNAADERHLATFEADADGTARAGGLAFATATAGFTVAAGFALAEAFAAMFGAGSGFQIM